MKFITKLRILFLFAIFISIALPTFSRHRKLKSKTFSHKEKGTPKDKCSRPGFLRRALNFVGSTASSVGSTIGSAASGFVKIFYDPEYWRQYQEAIENYTTNNMKKKNELLNQIINEHPDLTDSQIIRINYYLGTKTFNEMQESSAKIKNNILNFIQNNSGEKNNDSEYIRAIQKILLINQPEMSNMIIKMDYLGYAIYSDMHQRIHDYFLANELELFEAQLHRFSELRRRFHSKKAQRSKFKTPEFVQDKTQFALDSFKKNIDTVNGKAKSALGAIRTVKDSIKNTEILMNLSKALIEIDKIPVLEDVVAKAKVKVEQIDKLPIVDKVKKASGRADIVSLMIKCEQGKAEAKDYIDLADKLSKEFGVESLKKPLDVAKSLANIKKNVENFQKSEKASVKIGNILLGLGNMASISPDPVTKTVGKVLKSVGTTITTYKSVQNIIDEEVEIFVSNTNETLDQGRLPFFSQVISDFAIDAFVYDPTDQERKHSISEVFDEVKDRYLSSAYSEEIKNTIQQINDERLAASERGEVDMYSNAGMGADWDIGERPSVDNSKMVEMIREKYEEFKESVRERFSSDPSSDNSFSFPSDDNQKSNSSSDSQEESKSEPASSWSPPTYDITETDTEKCFERDSMFSNFERRKLFRKMRKIRKFKK